MEIQHKFAINNVPARLIWAINSNFAVTDITYRDNKRNLI
jgi:hypothetical protein